MKKFLKVLGIIFLCIILLFIALGLYVSTKTSEYEVTAVPFINEVIPKLSTWDVEVFKEYSTHESNEASSDEDLSKLLRWFTKLGKLEGIGVPVFKSIMNGNLITYIIPVKYEAGEATITLTLRDTDGEFLIHYFNLNSLALVE